MHHTAKRLWLHPPPCSSHPPMHIWWCICEGTKNRGLRRLYWIGVVKNAIKQKKFKDGHNWESVPGQKAVETFLSVPSLLLRWCIAIEKILLDVLNSLLIAQNQFIIWYLTISPLVSINDICLPVAFVLQMKYLSLFHIWGNLGTQNLSGFSKVTWFVLAELGIQNVILHEYYTRNNTLWIKLLLSPPTPLQLLIAY